MQFTFTGRPLQHSARRRVVLICRSQAVHWVTHVIARANTKQPTPQSDVNLYEQCAHNKPFICTLQSWKHRARRRVATVSENTTHAEGCAWKPCHAHSKAHAAE